MRVAALMAEDTGLEVGRRTYKHPHFMNHNAGRQLLAINGPCRLRRTKSARLGRAGASCHAKAALLSILCKNGEADPRFATAFPHGAPRRISPMRASILHLPGFRTTHHPGRLTRALAEPYYGQSATRSSTMFNTSRLRGVVGPLTP